jgi:hypothetical protein
MRKVDAGAAGGLVFAVLSIIALAVLPPPPKAAASSGTVRHYLVAHSAAIRSASAVSVVAALALLPFFAAVKRRLTSPSGDTLFAAGILTCAVSVAGSALQAGLANAQGRLADDGLLTFYAVERIVFYVGPALTVGAVAAAAAVGYRHRLPNWLCAASAVLAAVAVLGGIASLVSESTAAGGIGLAGFVLTILWVAASSVVLLREDTAAPRARRGQAVAAT